jgi:hypothetical protein
MRFLSSFLSEFRGGFQKPGRFEVQLYPNRQFLETLTGGSLLTNIIDVLAPTIGQRIDPNFSMPQVVQWLARGLLCDNAVTPSRALETTSLNMYGISEEYPYSTEYTDFTCSFLMPLNAADCPVPRFFDYWHNFIHNNAGGPSAGLDFRFPEEYYATMILSQFDQQDHHSLSYRFEKVYPKLVQSQQIAWNQNTDVMRYNVTFVSSYWTILPYQPPPLFEINITL